MGKHAVKIPTIIPLLEWDTHGTWQETLQQELQTLPTDTLTMCLMSVSNVFFTEHPFVFDVQMHNRGGQWCPLSKFPGYEYCWETTDGRGLDQLNIHGPFNPEILQQLTIELEKRGLKLRNRWDLLITFGK
jgi:hypothetical protein